MYQVTELKVAIDEHIKFREKIKEQLPGEIVIPEKRGTPIMFMDCFEDFMKFMRNEGVPEHQAKVRSPKQLKDYERSITYFMYALTDKNIDVARLRFTSINSAMVGYYYNFLTVKNSFRHKTYNNLITYIKKFARYIIKTYELNMVSPFDEMEKKTVKPIVKSVYINEFYDLLEIVNENNGVAVFKDGRKKNYYRSWLVDAFKCGLYTGGRGDEIPHMKWNQIKLTPDGKMSHFEIRHFKLVNKSDCRK